MSTIAKFTLGALLLGGSGLAQSAQGLYWRNVVTGENYQHQLVQGQLRSQGDLPKVVAPWILAGSGDFNADGEDDLFWRNQTTGETAIQWMKQGQHQSFSDFIRASDLNWQVAAIGDLNGDGIDDLVWQYKTSGQLYLWLMGPTALKWEASLFKISDANWQLRFARDFDGDGKADLLFRNKTTGGNYLFLMDTATVRQQQDVQAVKDLNWQLVAAADLNGDKKTDLLWRNQTTGENYGFYMNGARVISEVALPKVADVRWQVRALTDLNGDGKADLLWWHSQSYQVVEWLMNGPTKLAESLLFTVTKDWQLQFARAIKPAYLGEPVAVPGRIQAEYYDRDGAGYGFADSDTQNQGDAKLRGDGVDIEATTDTGGGLNVGYIANGEWLKYTVKVAKAGNYKLVARVAGGDSTGQMHLEQQGKNLTGAISVAPTGGWQTWANLESPVFKLTAGEQSLKLVFDKGLFNLNYWDIVAVDSTSTGQPKLLLSENFDNASLPTSLNIGGSKAELVQSSDSFGGTGKSLKATYPAQAAGAGGGYLWSGFDLTPYNTDHIYIRFRAKMPKVTHGVKFVKVFGQHPVGTTGYANTTFGLDYTGVDAGLGSLNVVSFGDGASTENDTQNTLFLDGSYPQGVGRSYGLPGYAVTTPQAKAWRATDWGSDWHLFEFYVKFNSGDTASTEKNDGAISAKIDGKTYVDAKGLFNRHFSNKGLDRIEILGWSQTPSNQAVPEFELWYDNIEISLNGFMPDTQAPTQPKTLTLASSTSNSLVLNWAAATDNLAVKQYELLLNGQMVGTSTSTSFTFSQLTPATEYQLAVVAVDAAGNRSLAAAPVVAKTQSASTSGAILPVRISGLDSGASLTLTNNAEQLSLSRNGLSQFNQGLSVGASTDVRLTSAPRNQQCRIVNGTQTVQSAELKTVLVDCTHPVAASLAIAAEGSAPWPLKVLHGAEGLRNQAYPGIRYDSRLGVTGGVFPYEFRVLGLTRAGAAVDATGVELDFRRGLVRWTPATEGSYVLRIGIRDSNAAGAASLTQDIPIEVTASKFRFVSDAGSDSADAGSLTKPFKTFKYALANTPTTSALYVRAGRYNAGSFSLDGSTTASLMAYPDEVATLDLNFGGISFAGDARLTRLEGFDIANVRQYGIFVATAPSGLVVRNNRFLNGREFNDGEAGDRGIAENPSFIFTQGDSASRHFGVMIQDNVFGPLAVRRWLAGDGTMRSSGGASMVLYDTVDTLVENNLVDCGTSSGISDKDNSVRNSIRENVILDRDAHSTDASTLTPIQRTWLPLDSGLNLMAQDGAQDLQISHNLLENSDISLGVQCFQTSCAMKNIYLHHNTIIAGNIGFTWGAFEPLSTNFNTFYNVFAVAAQPPYGVLWGEANPPYNKLRFNRNIVQTSSTRIVQGDGSAASISRTDWQTSMGFDKDSIFAASGLVEGSAEKAGLLVTYPLFGQYGHRY